MARVTEDVRFRKVKALQGRARDEALKQHLSENDLVVVRTTIGSLPEYEIEKVSGDPIQFLFNLGKKEVK